MLFFILVTLALPIMLSSILA